MSKFNDLCGYLVGNQKRLLILLIAGVGVFRDNGKVEFYSHAGDYIGSAPKQTVEHMIHTLKRKGVNRSMGSYWGRQFLKFGGVTYIGEELVHPLTIMRWMNYYFEYPIEIEWKPSRAKIKPTDAAMRAVSWLRVAVVYSWWPTLVEMSSLRWLRRSWDRAKARWLERQITKA